MGDPCSLANLQYFKIKHLDWSIFVDFENKSFDCTSSFKITCLQEGTKLVLDSSHLLIEEVLVNGTKVHYEVGEEKKPFGQPLQIDVSKHCQLEKDFEVTIKYKTSPSATAVQWLEPEQTLGKKHPYLFTQCQAIHARSLVPCQDSPGLKFTYTAQVNVPEGLVALMSAVKGEEIKQDNGRKICHFQQNVPIPAYLLAIAVGELEQRTVGPRSKVWCEAQMVDACEYEFGEVEDMLKAGESLMGPYVWGQYDVLILPPSFPYGGMENPCLTFATPTILAGDRSLMSLAAHEITHSWTGNLVTNKNWEHFWLNEGCTRFMEGKIMGLLQGEQTRQHMAIAGWATLRNTIEVFGATNPLTALQPKLEGVDPDDAFSSVPYENGYAFLYYIESLVGGAEHFNPFMRSYIEKFKYSAVTTDDFKNYLMEYFKDKSNELNKIDWDAWLFSPGMPPVDVVGMYDHTLSHVCQKLFERWMKSSVENEFSSFNADEFSSLSTRQKTDFLNKLMLAEPITLEATKQLAQIYQMINYKNSEVRFLFLRLCVRAKWKEIYAKVVEFLLEQGRMKFVRPLYRDLYKDEDSRELAVNTFQANRRIYHCIASSMIAKDLKLV